MGRFIMRSDNDFKWEGAIMTHKDKGNYARKHAPERKVNPEIAEAVQKKASKGEISCAAASGIAKDLVIPPQEVGFTIDALEISIVKCQMGLYGYRPERRALKPAEAVEKDLETALRGALLNGRIPCATAWDIAARFGLAKMEVASACEALKIKISSCQLGAF
jgi:hypothetical protein